MLKFIFIAFMIYLGFRFILKPLLRILLQEMIKKVVDNSVDQVKRQQSGRAHRPEGTINVDYIPEEKDKARSSRKKDDGEYVDYEEVK